MSRLARLAPLLALAAALAWPHAALAAPPDRREAGVAAAAPDRLAWLWQPLARLFGAGGADVGPGMDPDGAAAASGSAGDGGPTMDPDGLTGGSGSGSGAAPPPAGTESTSGSGDGGDVGPGADPDG